MPQIIGTIFKLNAFQFYFGFSVEPNPVVVMW